MAKPLDPALAARVASARLLYTRSPVPLSIIAQSLGLGVATLRRRMPALAWPPGRRGSRRANAEPPSAARQRPMPEIDRRAVAQSLERFVAERIAVHQADVAAGRDADPERTARAVGHYARALSLVRAYLADLETNEPVAEPGPPPRSLSELRDELRGHLERIRDEERTRRGLDGAEPHPGGNGADP